MQGQTASEWFSAICENCGEDVRYDLEMKILQFMTPTEIRINMNVASKNFQNAIQHVIQNIISNEILNRILNVI